MTARQRARAFAQTSRRRNHAARKHAQYAKMREPRAAYALRTRHAQAMCASRTRAFRMQPSARVAVYGSRVRSGAAVRARLRL